MEPESSLPDSKQPTTTEKNVLRTLRRFKTVTSLERLELLVISSASLPGDPGFDQSVLTTIFYGTFLVLL